MDVFRAPLAAPPTPRRRWVAALERIARTHLLSRFDRRRVVFRWRAEAVRHGESDLRVDGGASIEEVGRQVTPVAVSLWVTSTAL